ncbi:MAG: membrane protein insertion efficiency factor YidD [Clostridia bacterium]|nr:membrane protein insertion efficiency factor YidD [Clostridia bacterium]
MKRFLLFMIRLYRRGISPHTKPSCRFIPTCSEYAETAVRRFGAVRGGGMAIKRIMRCNPFSEGGYDPVPEAPSAIIRRDENP